MYKSILLVILFLISSCDDPKVIRKVNTSESTWVNVICLGGHEYYRSSYALAPVLTDNGRPIICK